MGVKIDDIIESEGVIRNVRSEGMEYPCQPFTPDYSLLVDESLWADIGYTASSNEGPSDTLFNIKCDETDAKLSHYLAYFIASGEYSSRGVYITSLIISRNPANYTAWAYRMDCAEQLQLPLADELEFARQLVDESPKSYQAWQYRRRLCEFHNELHNELDFIKYEISSSPKNHCAWSHLTWMVTSFPVSKEQFTKELEFVEFLLSDDVYNNTAWVYKNFLVEQLGHYYELKEEIAGFVSDVKRMLQSPWNESLSNYLINKVSRISEKNSGCIKLEHCGSSCEGGPGICTIKCIEGSKIVTTPMLWLHKSLTSEMGNPSQLSSCNPLQLSDPLRF